LPNFPAWRDSCSCTRRDRAEVGSEGRVSGPEAETGTVIQSGVPRGGILSVPSELGDSHGSATNELLDLWKLQDTLSQVLMCPPAIGAASRKERTGDVHGADYIGGLHEPADPLDQHDHMVAHIYWLVMDPGCPSISIELWIPVSRGASTQTARGHLRP